MAKSKPSGNSVKSIGVVELWILGEEHVDRRTIQQPRRDGQPGMEDIEVASQLGLLMGAGLPRPFSWPVPRDTGVILGAGVYVLPATALTAGQYGRLEIQRFGVDLIRVGDVPEEILARLFGSSDQAAAYVSATMEQTGA